MTWHVKPFNDLQLNELYAVLKLRSEVFVVEQSDIYLDCDDCDQRAYHLMAHEGEVLVAYLRILPTGVAKPIMLGRVVVAASYRGQKLGEKLLTRAMDFITGELKENQIQLSSLESVVPFYEKWGFQAISEPYPDNIILHVDMLWKK